MKVTSLAASDSREGFVTQLNGLQQPKRYEPRNITVRKNITKQIFDYSCKRSHSTAANGNNRKIVRSQANDLSTAKAKYELLHTL